MLFTKSAPVVSRSALSKKFWRATPSSSQGVTGPGFFVSTPQFNRHQQNQIAVYYEDTRGAGNSNSTSDSHGIDNPYLALTAGGNTTGGAPGLHFEDDAKEDSNPVSSLRSSNSALGSLAPSKSAPPESDSLSLIAEITTDAIADVVDQTGKVTVVEGIIEKMMRLRNAGSHRAVLAAFEVLETIESALPVEAYNLVLESIAITYETATLLEVYERMLTRGVKPNDDTYCIILSSLAETSASLASVRLDLAPFVGTSRGVLESVDEIREGIAMEEYLALSHNIILALAASHPQPWSDKLQACIDRIFQLSVESNVDIPESLLSVVTKDLPCIVEAQPSIQQAAEKFESLSPVQQQSEAAQLGMLHSYFKFNEVRGAIAFYAGCGSPAYLLRPLVVGFASSGLVATANRWANNNKMDTESIGAVLSAIKQDGNASDVLPSATELFYKYVSNGGGDGSSMGGTSGKSGDDQSGTSSDPSSESVGRCAYLRLCVAAGNENALLMALKESHLRGVTWDAVTLEQVLGFLRTKKQPLLAADVCAWQIPKLVSVYNKKNLKGFISEEIVSNLIRKMIENDQLSLDAAIRILPVANYCASTRKHVIETVAAARLGAPHEVSALMNNDETIMKVVSSLASIMLTSWHRVIDEEMSLLRRIFPLFVEDALMMKADMNVGDAFNVEEALNLCENVNRLKSIWKKKADSFSPEDRPVSEVSLAIKRYALAPNGVYHALSILKDQTRLKRKVSAEAIKAVVCACVDSGEPYLLDSLYRTLPKTKSNLNALIVAASQAEKHQLAQQCHDELVNTLQVYPSVESYFAMIKSNWKDPLKALDLFVEAKEKAQWKLGSDIYNTIAMILANDLRSEPLANVLVEMQESGISPSVSTYGSILRMYVRLGDGDRSLQILKNMPVTAKSLLDVTVFNELMTFFVHQRHNRRAALDVFMELRATGTLASTATYRLLMEAYLLKDKESHPNLKNADQVLNLMRRDGAPMSTQCFATLLRARGVLFKDFDGARNFYRGLVKNSRVLPDRGIFHALMESYVANGKSSEVELVLQEMKRYHVPMDESIQNLVSASI